MDDHPRTYSVWMEGTAMANQANDPLEALRRNPEAAAFLGNPAALAALLRSPETQKLVRLLEETGGNQLQQAAGQAVLGDTTALKRVVDRLMDSKDGAQAVEALQRRAKPEP